MSISDNIKRINERIEKAAQKSGRSGKDITLVAVTKTVDLNYIEEAFACGALHFGENKVQELVKKQPALPRAKWHLIGHLQTNKVKYIVDKAHLIHSVDSLRLAGEIDARAKKHNLVSNVLIQINISGEATKSGISPGELPALLEGAQTLENIRVCGLMTMAPLIAGEAEIKKVFEKCNNLFIDIRGKKYHNIHMEVLSMGMTNDFEAAIECGANTVRIGTGIFGERNYN